MTEHVRTSYRSHRKATWALVLALTALIAAVVIPLAMAADKSYTMTVSSPVCTGPAPQTVVTLNNTSTSQTLGSAEIYFPRGTVASPVPAGPTSTTSPAGSWDIVQLNNLNIPRRSSRNITVTFLANVTFPPTVIQAAVKQSNQFNDTQGGANLFTLEGSFPTLRLVTCVTVSGRVYQDRNLDNTYTTGAGAFLDSDLPKAWKVELYAKNVGASSYPTTPYKTVNPSSATDGSYTFTQVPTGSDYKVCVVALAPDAAPKKWATQTPTGSDCAPITTAGPSSGAVSLTGLSADAIGPAPGDECEPDGTAACTDFQVVPVVALDAQGTSTVGGYTVDASSNSDSAKLAQFYVHDTWVDASGNTNFRFSPIAGGSATPCTQNCIYLLETLTADTSLSTLAGKQVKLLYDDSPPFLDGDLKDMPYCNVDPRQGTALATSGVLPGTEDTSCIVTATQTIVAGAKVRSVYTVYTSYDGGRQVG